MARKPKTSIVDRDAKIQQRTEDALQTFLTQIETGNFPAQIGKMAMLTVHGDVPAAKWSAGNQTIMVSAGTADARGYRQWQAAGRQVKKGVKAIYILSPRTATRTKENAEGEDEKSTFIVGWGFTPVFRYEDTEGEPIAGYDPPKLPPLVEVAESFGISVKYAPTPGRYAGYYNAIRREIVLCTHSERTFFHELAHAAHDKLGKLTKGGQDKRQEIVAETAAAALSNIYGLFGMEQYSRDYVAAYAESADDINKTLREILKYAQEVRDVVTLILTTAGNVAHVQGTA